MSKQVDIQHAGDALITVPGLGKMIGYAATTTAAGTAGWAPGAILITTSTLKVYTNTSSTATASWTIVGSQS